MSDLATAAVSDTDVAVSDPGDGIWVCSVIEYTQSFVYGGEGYGGNDRQGETGSI